MAVQCIASTDPTLGGSTLKHEGRRQTGRRSAYAGSRLKLIDASGRSRLKSQPSSRNEENSPCGMIGGIVETSASFEARSAPRSYPTHSRPRESKPALGRRLNNGPGPDGILRPSGSASGETRTEEVAWTPEAKQISDRGYVNGKS
jgi:hypothetical protein